mmetsp:Transcript_20956/g.42544  ORF Transcript_20956/g.42544 Transcript_20956/m.42544 type:complete len:243 (+) Transcript_20956:134-862(+)
MGGKPGWSSPNPSSVSRSRGGAAGVDAWSRRRRAAFSCCMQRGSTQTSLSTPKCSQWKSHPDPQRSLSRQKMDLEHIMRLKFRSGSVAAVRTCAHTPSYSSWVLDGTKMESCARRWLHPQQFPHTTPWYARLRHSCLEHRSCRPASLVQSQMDTLRCRTLSHPHMVACCADTPRPPGAAHAACSRTLRSRLSSSDGNGTSAWLASPAPPPCRSTAASSPLQPLPGSSPRSSVGPEPGVRCTQ